MHVFIQWRSGRLTLSLHLMFLCETKLMKTTRLLQVKSLELSQTNAGTSDSYIRCYLSSPPKQIVMMLLRDIPSRKSYLQGSPPPPRIFIQKIPRLF